MPFFQFPPYVLVLAASAAINIGLGAYSVYSNKSKVFFYFGMAYILSGLWPLLYGIELCIADREIIEMIAPYKALGMQFFSVFYMCFAFQLVKQKNPPKWLIYVMVFFALSVVFTMVTNDTYRMAWSRQIFITTKEGYNILLLVPGLWIKYTLIIYHYASDAVIIYLMIKGMIMHKYPYRTQYQLILLSMMLSIIISIIYVFGIMSFGPYNPLPGVFGFTSALAAVAVFRYHMLNITPYAKDTVFEIIDTPVIIIDAGEILIDYNHSAQSAFRLHDSHIGTEITDVFREIGLDWDRIIEDTDSIVETRWGAGKNFKYSAMKKFISKGDLKGYLIIFTDVTQQMDSIKNEHEKEIITYKESILGDMHDGIGGTVATAAIIAQTAMEEDDPEEKNRMISQIANLLENGSFELRSMLNILDKESIDWQALVSDMRSYSSTVLDSKAIKREFHANGTPYTKKIDFDIYISIFRLFKEAVTNIVKHSDAENAGIYVNFYDEYFKITINDDGKGIDETNTTGYGIKNMKRRAEKLGGTLEISSGKGTSIIISIPV